MPGGGVIGEVRPLIAVGGSGTPSMAKKRVKLVEFDRNRAVLDIALGRVVVEAESVRFHRNKMGRGLQVVGPSADGRE